MPFKNRGPSTAKELKEIPMGQVPTLFVPGLINLVVLSLELLPPTSYSSFSEFIGMFLSSCSLLYDSCASSLSLSSVLPFLQYTIKLRLELKNVIISYSAYYYIVHSSASGGKMTEIFPSQLFRSSRTPKLQTLICWY